VRPLVIDGYNNIWVHQTRSDYLAGEGFAAEQLLEAMDAAGVDMAVACSLGQAVDNSYIRTAQQRWPDRIIGFGQVDPRWQDPAAAVAECARAGLRGIKLHPTLHGYHICDHGLLDPVLAACADHGLAILVNALDDLFCAPLGIEEVARPFPQVPVLIAHMGTVWNVMEAILVAERTANLYLETSSAQLLDVRTAYRRLGPDKIIMGTDWPGSDFDLERAKIARAVPDATDRAKVEGGNLARLLRIRSTSPAASQLGHRS
jgi:predicted TIM-barrel fold metal-dependent hydrolase